MQTGYDHMSWASIGLWHGFPHKMLAKGLGPTYLLLAGLAALGEFAFLLAMLDSGVGRSRIECGIAVPLQWTCAGFAWQKMELHRRC